MSTDNSGIAQSLLSGVEFDDPRMSSLLQLLITDLYTLNNQINPPTVRTFGVSGIQLETIGQVQGFTATPFPSNLRLTWNALAGISFFEIRYKFGVATNADWDTANSILRTATLSADIDPISIPLIYGNHTFLIKATTTGGIVSAVASTVLFNVPQIAAPSLTATVIDNNVLLKWSQISNGSTWALAHYNVYKDGASLGEMQGTFEVIFETTAGDYTYGVEAQDIVGNIGSRTNLVVSVRQPPDFELQDNRVDDLSGTKVNTILENLILLCCLDTTETFEEHFSTRSWNSPQNQIDAGYPLHCQPTKTAGSYEHVIDYGTVINNTIATLSWSEDAVVAGIVITAKIASSLDNITYTSFTATSSLFIPTLRYLKIRFEFNVP